MTTVCTATVLGSPRIGPHRELKKAVEAYWAGRLDSAGLDAAGKDLRRQTWTALRDAGLDSIPVNTFSYYDHVLDTAAMLGALPERVAGIDSELDRYFAAARGNDTVAPLEMTKWFDTNYHYLVPEISPSTTFSLDASKVIGELAEAREFLLERAGGSPRSHRHHRGAGSALGARPRSRGRAGCGGAGHPAAVASPGGPGARLGVGPARLELNGARCAGLWSA